MENGRVLYSNSKDENVLAARMTDFGTTQMKSRSKIHPQMLDFAAVFVNVKTTESAVYIDNFCSERHKCKLCNLKELHSERYADYRHAQNNSPNKMTQRKRNTRYQKPDYVQKQGSCAASELNVLFKGEKAH